jgi:hypothetical protein
MTDCGTFITHTRVPACVVSNSLTASHGRCVVAVVIIMPCPALPFPFVVRCFSFLVFSLVFSPSLLLFPKRNDSEV